MISLDRSKLAYQLTQIAILTGSLYWSASMLDRVAASTVKPGLGNTPAVVKPPSQQLKAPQRPVLDTIIVPGKRVGAISPQTTYSDLIKIFGKQQLSSTTVYGPEGLVSFPGTVIKLGKNRSLTVAWKDAKKLQPVQVIIQDPNWKTASGIGLGTSLAKLRQILGEFKITGLGWDYGNRVIGLSPAIQSQYNGLSISVNADRVAAQKFPKDLMAVTGDGVTPAASDPHWQRLKMHVSALSVYFPTTTTRSKQ